MATRKNTPKRELLLSLSLSSLDQVHHRFSTVVAAAFSSVLAELGGKAAAKRVDVLASELVGNVLEHSTGRKAPLQVVLLAGAELELRVTNRVTPAVCERIKKHVASIRQSADVKSLMADTMQARRAEGRMGGVGLIRLVAETKAALSVRYDKSRSQMRVTARVPMGGSR